MAHRTSGDSYSPDSLSEVRREAFEGELEDDPLTRGFIFGGLELGKEIQWIFRRFLGIHQGAPRLWD